MRQSSVDAVIIGSVSTLNWCNVMAVLDNVAQHTDGEAYDTVCDVISDFPLSLKGEVQS